MKNRLDTVDSMLSRINNISHMFAAFWIFAIGIVICLDVLSRALFNAPFAGTAEIVGNSVVAIVFLQLPAAVHSGGMLRAEILDVFLSPAALRFVHAFGFFLGAGLFLAVAVSAWAPMLEAWSISEFAGNESTVQIPLYPIRTLLVLMSVLASINFMLLAVGNLRTREQKVIHHG